MSGSFIALIGLGLVGLSALSLTLRSGQPTLPGEKAPVLAYLGVLIGAIAVIGGLARIVGK